MRKQSKKIMHFKDFRAVMAIKIYMGKSCITSPPLTNYFSKLPQDSLHIWKNYLGDLNSCSMFCSNSPDTVELEGYFYSVSCHRASNLREMSRIKNKPKTKCGNFFFQ